MTATAPITYRGGPLCGKGQYGGTLDRVPLTRSGAPPVLTAGRYGHAVDCGCARGEIPIRGTSPVPHVYEWRPEHTDHPRPRKTGPCCAQVHPGCPLWEPKADAP